MEKSLFQLKEISIVLAAENHNPTILNPDFLKINNIVPLEWVLKEPPLCTFPIAQVVFDVGIRITSQLENLSFVETLTMWPTEISVPKLVMKYAETVPHVPYTGIGVNPKGHIEFDNQEDVINCINNTFVSQTVWSGHRPTLCKCTINLSWQFENMLFSLLVTPSTFEGTKPVVLFSANFHHDLRGLDNRQRLLSIQDITRDWKNDVDKLFSFISELDITKGRLLD